MGMFRVRSGQYAHHHGWLCEDLPLIINEEKVK